MRFRMTSDIYFPGRQSQPQETRHLARTSLANSQMENLIPKRQKNDERLVVNERHVQVCFYQRIILRYRIQFIIICVSSSQPSHGVLQCFMYRSHSGCCILTTLTCD